LLEGFPDRVVGNLFHPDIVELQKIDPIRFESFQGGLSGPDHCFRRKILRDFSLPASFVPVMDKIVPDLGRYHNLITLVGKRLCDQFFAQTVPVGIRCIKERYSKVERLAQKVDSFLLRKAAPPSGRDGPHPKPDFAHLKIGISISAIVHRASAIIQRRKPKVNLRKQSGPL
jgi:hypothetical protein